MYTSFLINKQEISYKVLYNDTYFNNQEMVNYIMKEILYQEHSGAVAFEYIIVAIMMTIVLFAGLSTLRWQYKVKTSMITNFLENNGQKLNTMIHPDNSAISDGFAKGDYAWDNNGQLTIPGLNK